MQTAREHPRQSGAIGPSDPPAESFIPQTGGPGNASFSFVSLATAASFGFGLKTILLDRDRGNDAGMSRSVPRPGRIGVAGAPPLRCGGICPAAGGDTEGVESRAAPMGAQQSRAATTRSGIRRIFSRRLPSAHTMPPTTAATATTRSGGSSTWSEPSANQAHRSAPQATAAIAATARQRSPFIPPFIPPFVP